MVTIFHDLIHVDMEVYVDDILIKSKTRENHPQILKHVLQRSREANLKMNLANCVFRVSSRKLVGFIMSNRGIELNLAKAKAIRDMPPLRNVREVRGLIRRLQFISLFISQHTKKCQPFYGLLKVGKEFKWTLECQEVFNAI
jgi:hypothetical protein